MTRCWVCNEEFGVDGSHICADTPFRIKAQQPQLLTDEEINDLHEEWVGDFEDFARDVETAVLKKNGVM